MKRPPTREFSAGYQWFYGFTNQSLTALATPLLRLITTQLRHARSQLVTLSVQGCIYG
jgi:hypothetical protein